MAPPARSPIPSSSHPSSHAHHHHHHHTATGQVGHPAAVAAANAHAQGASASAAANANASEDDDGKGELLKGLLDVWWSDDEEDDPECPLCMEEMDLSDVNFKPCPCGYQICRFCHHHILANLNKRCPACRRVYTEEDAEFVPVAPEEIKRLTLAKKNKQKVNRELEALGRRGLKDVRVIVKGCVYVTGMAVGQEGRAEEQLATLRSNDYFGQYGKISKLVLHKRPASASSSDATTGGSPAPVGIYITYLRREDASRAIAALDGFPSPSVPGTVLRASFGTAKYCESWLRNVRCELGQACMGLHEWGDERDVFRREDLSTLNVGIRKPAAALGPQGGSTGAGGSSVAAAGAAGAPSGGKLGKGRAEIDSNTALPRTASWASRPGASTPTPPSQPALSGLASLPPNPTLAQAHAASAPVPRSLGADRPLSSTAKTRIPGQLGALAAASGEPRMVTVKLSSTAKAAATSAAGSSSSKDKDRAPVVVSLTTPTTASDKTTAEMPPPPPGLIQLVKEKDRSTKDKEADRPSASSSRPATPALSAAKEAQVDQSTQPSTAAPTPTPSKRELQREREREREAAAAAARQPITNRPPPSSTPTPPTPKTPPSPPPPAAVAQQAPIVGTAPPPGLSLPPTRVSTPQPPAPATGDDEPYHPSTATQALLSDVTNQRRSPSPPPPGQGPASFGGLTFDGGASGLPDFGRMLAFDDGFAFQLRIDDKQRSRPPATAAAPAAQQPYDALPPHLHPGTSASVAPGAFSPFGFGLTSALGGILGAPAAAGPYVGSFDPFGDSPLFGSGSGQENDDPSSSRRSRFDFARRNSAKQPTDLPRFGGGGGGVAGPPSQLPAFGGSAADLLGSSRRGSQDLAFGGGFAWNVLNDGSGGGGSRVSGATSPIPGRQQQQQQHMQQPPPPGLSPLPSAASLQTQRHQQHQSGNSYAGGPPLSLKHPQLTLQQQQHQHQFAPLLQQQNGGANSWAQQQQPIPRPGSTTGGAIGGVGQQGMGAERMAFARQHQGQQAPTSQQQQQSQSQTLKEMLGVGSASGFGGYGNGVSSNGGDYGFQDPAIMSMRSSNQQRQQQQQPHQAFGASNGPHSPFGGPPGYGADLSGLDSQQSQGLSAFAPFGSQQDGSGRNGRLLQQQQQQGYFGAGRTPSPANLGGLASGLALLGLNNNARSSVTFDPVSPSGAADANQSTPTPQAALHKRAANPLIQVQEPTPRQPVLSRFGSDEGFVVGDGSPARKSNCSSGGGGSSPIGTAVPLPKASPPLPQLTTASSPLSVSHPERDTSWELDSDDEAATPTTSSAAGDKPSTAASQKDEADVRAALAAAAQIKPAPVTISLKMAAKEPTPAPAILTVAPTAEPSSRSKGNKGKAGVTSAAVSVAASNATTRTPTPDVSAATTSKKGWALPDAKSRPASSAPPAVGDGSTPGEALNLSRPTTPAAATIRGRQTSKVVETVSRATSAASSATGTSKSVGAAGNRRRSPSPLPFSAVEQPPVFSRKSKKEKNRTTAAKKKGGKAGAAGTAVQVADDDAEAAVAASLTADELAAKALTLANRPPPLELGDWYLPPPPAEPSSLSQLLHQLAPVLVASSLSFIAPLSHTRDLIETLSVASCLEPAPLAVALSALTTPTSDVTMEDAVAAFHQLLTLLTDTITGILNILPRDPPRDQDVAKRFGAMFMDVRRGTGLATRSAEGTSSIAVTSAPSDEPFAPSAHGAESRDHGEREVEKLKSALYQRANYLAEQLTRLEDLHEEINSMAVDALVKNHTENAPALAVTSNSVNRIEELETALLVARADVASRTADFAAAKQAAMGAFYEGNLVDLVWAGQADEDGFSEDDEAYGSFDDDGEEGDVEIVDEASLD